MTISSSVSRNDYTGTGSVSVYSYTFKIFANTDLLVTKRDTNNTETTLVLTTDYTVSGVGDTGGGSITLVAGNLPSGYHLTIRRVRPLTQETDIRNQGDFYPEIHEDAFDHHVMIDQQQGEELSRSVRFPETVTGVSNELPIPQANRYLRFDSAATAIEGVENLDVATWPNPMTTKGDLLTRDASGYARLAVDIDGEVLTVDSAEAKGMKWDSILNRLLSATASGTDTYTANLAPAIAAYTTGAHYFITFTNANTVTAPTLNLNSLGAKTIKKGNSSALSTGDISANHTAILKYNGTDMILLNPTQITNYAKGSVVQVQYQNVNSLMTGTTQMPADNTKPQNTEGDEYITVAITPTNASNILIVETGLLLSHTDVTATMGVALFKDDIANALVTTAQRFSASNALNTISLSIKLTAGQTTQMVLKVRAGANVSGSTNLNGGGGSQVYDGTAFSYLKVTEIQT